MNKEQGVFQLRTPSDLLEKLRHDFARLDADPSTNTPLSISLCPRRTYRTGLVQAWTKLRETGGQQYAIRTFSSRFATTLQLVPSISKQPQRGMNQSHGLNFILADLAVSSLASSTFQS